MMFKRKPKGNVTSEEVRSIIKEEILASARERKKTEDERRKKESIRRRLGGLSRSKRLKLLRFLKQKEAQHGEK